MKEYYLSKNKYIRLRVVKYYAYFRADISVNKYAFNEKVPFRYYEINFYTPKSRTKRGVLISPLWSLPRTSIRWPSNLRQ